MDVNTQSGAATIAEATGSDIAHAALESMAAAFHVSPEDVDLFIQHVAHRGQVYGTMVMARSRAQSGAISDADRSVLFALHDRLGAKLAQWYEEYLARDRSFEPLARDSA